MDLISLVHKSVPIFGVCLGHQCAGQFFGSKIVRAPFPMHGKSCVISHNGEGVFQNIPDNFSATRYHSLMIDPKTVPRCVKVTATSDDGVIQGIAHREFPVYGVQFHPESISSEYGHRVLNNFIKLSRQRQRL